MIHTNERKQTESFILHISFIAILLIFSFGFILSEPGKLNSDVLPIEFNKINPDSAIIILNVVVDKPKRQPKPKAPNLNSEIRIDEEEIDLIDEDFIIEIIPEKISQQVIELKEETPSFVTFAHQQPEIIKKVKPIYPDLARLMNKEGDVFVQLIVDKNGNPTNLRILKGHELFHDSALSAVSEYRFIPGLWNGKPVNVKMIIPIKYRLK